MSFMQSQVTEKQRWLAIDGNQGIFNVPMVDIDRNFLIWNYESQFNYLRAYYPGKPEKYEIVKGYGVRLSAPGYLDCTDWDVYPTLEQAKQSALELDAEMEFAV